MHDLEALAVERPFPTEQQFSRALMAFSRVYSTRFVHGRLTAPGTHAGYVVPAGKVAVVRDVCVNAYGATTGGWAGAGLIKARWALPTDNTSWQWRGDQVFNAGDLITFVVATGGADVSICGFLLGTA